MCQLLKANSSVSVFMQRGLFSLDEEIFKVGSCLALWAATVISSFLSQKSRYSDQQADWSRKSAILIVIDANCFLKFYFYRLTSCVYWGLFWLLCLILHVAQTLCCFNLSNLIKVVPEKQGSFCFSAWEQLHSFPNEASIQEHEWNRLTTLNVAAVYSTLLVALGLTFKKYKIKHIITPKHTRTPSVKHK